MNNPLINKFESLERKLFDMPRWLFWSLLFSLTWFYLIRRVISWDLWWHMAAGRFIVENGYYPPLDTFTYTPTSGTKALSHVWLGDVIFYEVYNWFGFLGLQGLRCLMVLSAVWVILQVSKYRYNVWTLLASAFLIIGTMQKHLIKNAIFSMFFVSMFAWAWIQIKYYNKRYLVWVYAIAILFWNHMHGSAKIGVGFLGLILLGECIDQLISFLRKKKTDLLLLGSLSIVVLSSFLYTDARWGMGLNGMFNHIMKSIAGSSESKANSVSEKSQKDKSTKKEIKNKVVNEQSVRESLKKVFRVIFKGTDAEMVAEYQYPFDITYVLSIKFLFFLVIFYTSYLILKLFFDIESFRFSMELPCLAFLYVSMGYLRTVSFSFLTIIPFMVFGATHTFHYLSKEKRMKAFYGLGGIVLLSSLVYIGSDFIQIVLKLFHDGMKNKETLGDISYLVSPFYFAIPAIAMTFLIKNDELYKLTNKVLRFGLSIWIIICLCCYAVFENKKYVGDSFHEVTGFLDTEQGFGKSNKFFYGMADYVVEKYPNEHIYNTYNMGGFLLWRWYGKRKVFIDGRSAVYDAEFYKDYTRNNAVNYINKYKLKVAIMNLLVDRDRVMFFLKSGWYPVAFDACMVVMHRPQNIQSSYNVIPKFFEGDRPIYGFEKNFEINLKADPKPDGFYPKLISSTVNRIFGNSLELLDRKAVGIFLNQATYHMLLAGRIKDTEAFMNQAEIKRLMNQMPHEIYKALEERNRFTQQLKQHFGAVNHPQIGHLCKQIFNKIQGHPYHIAMGDTYYALKNLPKAEAEFLQAYRIKKDDLATLNKLGDIFYRQNKHQQSIASYNEAIKLKPNDASYYNNISLPMLRMGAKEDALKFSNKSIQLNPKYFQAYYNRGMILLAMNKLKEAHDSFAHALKINPKFTAAKSKLDEVKKMLEKSS